MITLHSSTIHHHRLGHIIVDAEDAREICRLLGELPGSHDAATMIERLTPNKNQIGRQLMSSVPRTLLEDESTEWVHFRRGGGLSSLAHALRARFSSKGGATSEEWDLWVVLEMAGVRHRIRKVDVPSVRTLLEKHGLRAEALEPQAWNGIEE